MVQCIEPILRFVIGEKSITLHNRLVLSANADQQLDASPRRVLLHIVPARHFTLVALIVRKRLSLPGGP